MEVTGETLTRLLEEAGLNDVGLDRHNHPQPGRIVRIFRERMTYIDSDGVEKHWTQKDLAEKLDISEVSGRAIELKNTGLDSIERRRTLATLLKIPPALLGLSSAEQLADTLTKAASGEATVSNIIISKQTDVSYDDIKLYKSALDVYSSMYTYRTIQTSIENIEAWIAKLDDSLKNARSSQKPEILQILFHLHRLCAGTYGYDLCNWTQAFRHINEERKIAEILDDPDLKARCFYLSGKFYLAQQNPILAKSEFDIALNIKGISVQTEGVVTIANAVAYAQTATDLASVTNVQKMSDRAKQFVDMGDNGNGIIFSTKEYVRDKAETLISIGRYGKALELIQDTKLLTSDNRLLEYMDILQAECYIKQKKPELEHAVILLENILEQNKTVKEQSHIQYINRLFKVLETSKYGNSPHVTDLGITLRNLQSK